MKMNHKIYIADLGKLIQEEEQAIALRRALYNGKAIDLENYHTYEEVKSSDEYALYSKRIWWNNLLVY